MWQELRVISCACMCLMCLLVLRALEAESLVVLQQFSTEVQVSESMPCDE